jgi:gliding motility-associated-like protein
LPVAKYSARPLTVYIPGEPVIFTNESSQNAVKYKWAFGDGGTSAEKHPSHEYSIPGEYQTSLVITSALGCRDTFALPEKIMVIQETIVLMPNAFTPNEAGSPGTIFAENDMSNDIFHPKITGADKYQFSIYSRWGELLFDTRDPREGWDGYYKGKICTQDVYVWKINATFIDGKTYNKTGDVLLLR